MRRLQHVHNPASKQPLVTDPETIENVHTQKSTIKLSKTKLNLNDSGIFVVIVYIRTKQTSASQPASMQIYKY